MISRENHSRHSAINYRHLQSAKSLYIQVYPSSLVNASRMQKIARSVHATGQFSETHLVGVRTEGLPEWQQLEGGPVVVRLQGSGQRGNLGRALRMLLWQPRVYLRYRTLPLAAVAAHNVWVLPLCWLLCLATGASLVYNAHELETETATMKGMKQALARRIERRYVARAAVVSVVNAPIADWYASRYEIDRPIVVGNVPTVRSAEVNLRGQLGIESDEMLYIHTGHLVGGRNIPLILSAFSACEHHVVFLGDGPLRESVLAFRRAHANIHWMPPVAPELIVAHVREADVGLCLVDARRDLSDTLSSPNKLLESLAAHRPALCSDLVEARRLLGPLADGWVLTDPDTQIAGALDSISKKDVADFVASWQGVATWDEEVAPLLDAYRQILTYA